MDYILSAVSAVLVVLFGFMLRRNSKLHDEASLHFHKEIVKLEKDLEHFEHRLRQAMSRAEVRELLDDKLEPIHVLLREIKEDINQVRRQRN